MAPQPPPGWIICTDVEVVERLIEAEIPLLFFLSREGKWLNTPNTDWSTVSIILHPQIEDGRFAIPEMFNADWEYTLAELIDLARELSEREL